jgi:hypothetical protein
MSLTGFLVVDRKRLKALPAETLHQLAATDELELIYLHLQSVLNFNTVKNKLIETQVVTPSTEPGVEPEASDSPETPVKAGKRAGASSTSKAS